MSTPSPRPQLPRLWLPPLSPRLLPPPRLPLLLPRLLPPVRLSRVPCPATSSKINVAQGQSVKEGDTLIVLEAMKMENDVVAPRDGTVAQIVVTKGAVVETGSPLVILA